MKTRTIGALMVLAAFFSVLVYGTIGYVALHFIRKVW